MNYAQIYIEEKDKITKIIAPVNQVRIYKKMILPCELVGIAGNYIRKKLDISYFKWKVDFPNVPKLSKKLLILWKEYVEWLCLKKIQSVYDFEDKIQCRY